MINLDALQNDRSKQQDIQLTLSDIESLLAHLGLSLALPYTDAVPRPQHRPVSPEKLASTLTDLHVMFINFRNRKSYGNQTPKANFQLIEDTLKSIEDKLTYLMTLFEVTPLSPEPPSAVHPVKLLRTFEDSFATLRATIAPPVVATSGKDKVD